MMKVQYDSHNEKFIWFCNGLIEVLCMNGYVKLQALIRRFESSLPYYKDNKNAYNEHSCRIEYILPLYHRLQDMISRDVPNATSDTWYQYGRTQALTTFINMPKLIVGVLSKEPMYAFDAHNMLMAPRQIVWVSPTKAA
jgi:hypothetical protein